MTIENMMEGQKPANLYFRYKVIEKKVYARYCPSIFVFIWHSWCGSFEETKALKYQKLNTEFETNSLLKHGDTLWPPIYFSHDMWQLRTFLKHSALVNHGHMDDAFDCHIPQVFNEV